MKYENEIGLQLEKLVKENLQYELNEVKKLSQLSTELGFEDC